MFDFDSFAHEYQLELFKFKNLFFLQLYSKVLFIHVCTIFNLQLVIFSKKKCLHKKIHCLFN